MLTFAPPSRAPTVAAWLESLSAPFATVFQSTPCAPNDLDAATRAVAIDAPLETTRPKDIARDCVQVDQPNHGIQAPAVTDTLQATEGGGAAGPTYWPCERLNAFILQMAAHGHCVSAAMMLGHRPYAVQQLAAAQQVPNDSLRALAAELQAYFDAPPDSAAQARTTI